MNKDTLRNKMIDIRNNISNKEEKSTIIVHKIQNLKIFQQSKIIACYKGMKSEVNLDKLIDTSLKEGKIVLLPRIINNQIYFIQINAWTTYEKSRIGVLEPIVNNNVYYGDIDLILVPGICFDKKNNRLGFGKGYYDRILKDIGAYKIGVCFEEQLVDIVPIEEHDISMDLVIHNKKRIKL